MEKKQEEENKQPVPVMKQLARPISKEELAEVSGARSTPTRSDDPRDIDMLD